MQARHVLALANIIIIIIIKNECHSNIIVHGLQGLDTGYQYWVG